MVTRTLARATGRSAGAGLVSLELRPAAVYRPLMKRVRGLYATVTVEFTADGEGPLRYALPVDFIVKGTSRHRR